VWRALTRERRLRIIAGRFNQRSMTEPNDNSPSPCHVTVLGAGSWGTALAHLLAENGHTVTLWDRNPEIVSQIQNHHINATYLPTVTLQESLTAVNSMKEAFAAGPEWAVIAVSSSGIRAVAAEMSEYLTPNCSIISATKGLDADTGLTMSEIVTMIFNDATYSGLAVLSGPNLAQEVVRRIPSAAVSASDSLTVARGAQRLLMSPHAFRVYTHNDVRGVELGGALKNVLAIGAGISDGIGFGDNTKALLMTRGLMEMSQLGLAAGAKALTFLGLAGVGDLMATAGSNLSRNYRVGLGLAQRKPLQAILDEIGHVAEGIPTAKAAIVLARRYQTEIPLFETIYDVIYNGKSPSVAVYELMSRPAKDEFA
jgi:glycerol-3-phosphate dehydrogenase (NAD(P)+)